jgi:hypothetical protein
VAAATVAEWLGLLIADACVGAHAIGKMQQKAAARVSDSEPTTSLLDV